MIEERHMPKDRQNFKRPIPGHFATRAPKARERVEIDRHKGDTIAMKPSSINRTMMIVKQEELAMRERRESEQKQKQDNPQAVMVSLQG